MNDLAHLHDRETLLCAMRPGASLLVGRIAAAFIGSAIAALVVTLLLAATIAFAFSGIPGMRGMTVAFVILLVTFFALSSLRQVFLWRKASFRITTERILMHYPKTLFSHFDKTIKWNQYQESYVGHAGVLSLLLGTRPLCIRYGNADGELTMCFPSLRRAHDLKHYLDKVDSAARHGQEATVPPFVAKPKGQRDVVEASDAPEMTDSNAS